MFLKEWRWSHWHFVVLMGVQDKSWKKPLEVWGRFDSNFTPARVNGLLAPKHLLSFSFFDHSFFWWFIWRLNSILTLNAVTTSICYSKKKNINFLRSEKHSDTTLFSPHNLLLKLAKMNLNLVMATVWSLDI